MLTSLAASEECDQRRGSAGPRQLVLDHWAALTFRITYTTNVRTLLCPSPSITDVEPTSTSVVPYPCVQACSYSGACTTCSRMLVSVHSPEIDFTTDSIICNVFPTKDGWRVHVRLPRRVSPHDRQEVLSWLSTYRAEVRRRNPFWVARFTDTQRDLTLDFLSADDPKAGLANMFKFSHVGGYGSDSSDYASP